MTKKVFVIKAYDENNDMEIFGVATKAVIAKRIAGSIPKYYSMVEIEEHVLDAVSVKHEQGRLSFVPRR